MSVGAARSQTGIEVTTLEMSLRESGDHALFERDAFFSTRYVPVVAALLHVNNPAPFKLTIIVFVDALTR